MTRKALIVGIDNYEHTNPLHGCANDACSIKNALERNFDGTVNFDIRLLTARTPAGKVLRKDLRCAVRDLFSGTHEVALFYFAGHGHIEETGGYIFVSDSMT